MTVETTSKETVSKPDDDAFDEYLEYTLGSSNKFWGIKWVDNVSINVYWGRIDAANCQTHKKIFGYKLEAIRWLREKISEKKNKGYA